MADLGSVLRNNPGLVAADGSMYDEFNAGLPCDVDVVLIRKGLFLGLPESARVHGVRELGDRPSVVCGATRGGIFSREEASRHRGGGTGSPSVAHA